MVHCAPVGNSPGIRRGAGVQARGAIGQRAPIVGADAEFDIVAVSRAASQRAAFAGKDSVGARVVPGGAIGQRAADARQNPVAACSRRRAVRHCSSSAARRRPTAYALPGVLRGRYSSRWCCRSARDSLAGICRRNAVASVEASERRLRSRPRHFRRRCNSRNQMRCRLTMPPLPLFLESQPAQTWIDPATIPTSASSVMRSRQDSKSAPARVILSRRMPVAAIQFEWYYVGRQDFPSAEKPVMSGDTIPANPFEFNPVAGRAVTSSEPFESRVTLPAHTGDVSDQDNKSQAA